MSSQQGQRRSLRAAAIVFTAAIGVGATAGIASAAPGQDQAPAQASAGVTAPAPWTNQAPPAPPMKADVSNAEWLNPMCDVPEDRDLDVTKTVYKVAEEEGANEKVLLSAFEAGWVESHMNNLDCGDSDSVGVFQQRPSQGWCDDPADCEDVEYATKSYLEAAIANEESNPDYSAGELAQSVQRSAYPDRYDEAEDKAKEMIEEAEAEQAS